MSHKKSSDKIMFISETDTARIIRKQQKPRVFNAAGSEDIFLSANAHMRPIKDPNAELSHLRTIFACLKAQGISIQINAYVFCLPQFRSILRTKSRWWTHLHNLTNKMWSFERFRNVTCCNAPI